MTKPDIIKFSYRNIQRMGSHETYFTNYEGLEKIMLLEKAIPSYNQIPLFHDIFEDEKYLLNSPDTQWYTILKSFPWKNYQPFAIDYYRALCHFNKNQILKHEKLQSPIEGKEDATQRLLFSRSTMDEAADILIQEQFKEINIDDVPGISIASVAPGVVPSRLGGKKPKCFFAMLESFIGASLMGFEPTPERVYSLLTSNLAFARVCGFRPKEQDSQYSYLQVPSLRKLEQFDQIMTEYGIWSKCKNNEVIKNLKTGVIQKENVLVGDTTHYYAYSGFKTVSYTDDKGKEKRKSQSKTTKNCNCKDKENCHHPWELVDDGAGTIVKAHNKYIWGHKASYLGLPLQGIILDVIAVADAATNDGETFYPHVEKVLEQYPTVKEWIDIALYDSACDHIKLKGKFKDELNLDLKASLNPRRKKTVTENIPRGMEKVTPYGNVICNAGYEMDYLGIRYKDEKYIYQWPTDKNGNSVCLTCEHKSTCCPYAKNGRTIQVSFDVLSHINPDDPPMAKRFKAMMMRRPSVERMIKRLKCDLSSARLNKRGNENFQAYLDKTLIAYHILLRS